MLRAIALLFILFSSPALAERVSADILGRSYLADLPAQPAGAPILVVLHGAGGWGAQVANNSRMSRPANRAGYVVLYPTATVRDGLRSWNSGYGPPARREVDDIRFLDAMISDAAARFSADPDRVYMAGMSNGAMMAESYAASRPGRVKAVAGVAGTMNIAAFRVRGPVPLLQIHGTADGLVPYNGGPSRFRGVTYRFASVADVVGAFVRAQGDGLRRTEQIIDPANDGMRTVATNWSRGGKVRVRLLTVEGGRHLWPGGRGATPRRGGTQDIDATAEILAFFAQFR